MFTLADTLLTAHGYRHYEISNYARDGAVSLHNLACWRGEDYYGLGPGACGTVQGIRYQNTKDTTEYINLLSAGLIPSDRVEHISEQQRRTEQIALMLRTDEGLPLRLLRPQDDAFLAMLQHECLAYITPSGLLQLTLAGRLVADEIAVGLME